MMSWRRGDIVGHITIIDNDVVELSNIHRQIGHSEQSARNHCVALEERFTKANAPKLIAEHEYIVDCCDNIETRYIINDECVRQGKCFVSAATQCFSGQVMFRAL